MLTTIDEKKTPCRFDMFTRRKKDAPGPVRNAKQLFTYRGDKYSQEPSKMMKYLIGIVLNYHKQFAVMQIHDNSIKPAGSPERIILKILNGVPKINRLPNYVDLLTDYPLPEFLSYEIDNNKIHSDIKN